MLAAPMRNLIAATSSGTKPATAKKNIPWRSPSSPKPKPSWQRRRKSTNAELKSKLKKAEALLIKQGLLICVYNSDLRPSTNRPRIVLRNHFVGGDEPRKIVGL